jgi:hypothetical protein
LTTVLNGSFGKAKSPKKMEVEKSEKKNSRKIA